MRNSSSSREPALHDRVQLARGAQVVAERLLDDQPCPALAVAPLADLTHHRLERLRRHGEVVEAVPGGAALGVDLLERLPDEVLAALAVELGGDVPGAGHELLPDVGPERVAPCSFTPCFIDVRNCRWSAACARRRRRRNARAAGA